MGRIIVVYGLIAGVLVAVLMLLAFTLLPRDHGPIGVFVGFLNMFIALSMVLVGIKQYRDQHQGGVITFKRGFLVGLGVAMIAALFYVLAWETYLAVTGLDFMGEYVAAQLDRARERGASAAELAQMAAKAEADKAAYANPVIRMAWTFVEIGPVALLVTVVSALLLKNPRFLPARTAAA